MLRLLVDPVELFRSTETDGCCLAGSVSGTFVAVEGAMGISAGLCAFTAAAGRIINTATVRILSGSKRNSCKVLRHLDLLTRGECVSG